MADATVTFGATAGFGSVTNMAAQSNTSSTELERKIVLDAAGNYAASKTYNSTTSTTTTYKATTTSSISLTELDEIGAIVNSIALTGLSIQTVNDDYATVICTGHQHAANAHTSLRKGSHGITLTSGWGAQDFLGGTAGDDAAVVSSSCEITVEHVDEMDTDGDHISGQNYNGVIHATVDWIGVPSATSDGTWDITSTETPTDNQGFVHTRVTGIKYVSLA